MNNQSGIITLDFIFALVISFSMTAILFAMTFTLTVVEVAQYVTFSSARAQAAGNKSPLEQAEAARKKYDLLVQNPVLKPLFSNGWFEISNRKEIEVKGGGNLGSFVNDYPSKSDSRKVFMGVRTKFTAKVLDMKLPFLGNTEESDGGFSTRIATILIREPSEDECRDFLKARFDQINQLDSRFSEYTSKQNYFPMEDAGC